MTKYFLAIALLIIAQPKIRAQFTPGVSIYTQKIEDTAAAYFTPGNPADVSTQLQAAIDQLKRDRNFGVLFIPEGTYYISKTIYIPGAIRLIGYGSRRPLIILKKRSPASSKRTRKTRGTQPICSGSPAAFPTPPVSMTQAPALFTAPCRTSI